MYPTLSAARNAAIERDASRPTVEVSKTWVTRRRGVRAIAAHTDREAEPSGKLRTAIVARRDSSAMLSTNTAPAGFRLPAGGIVSQDFVAGIDQVRGKFLAHVAEPDEADDSSHHITLAILN